MRTVTKFQRIAVVLGLGLLAASASAADVDVKLDARVRTETISNGGFAKADNSNHSTGSRFRASMLVKADEQTTIFFQPQYTNTWGTNATTLTEDSASVHQAYISHTFMDNYTLKLGKQEINFGDQLLVGSVGWSNVGRTFDALKLTSKIGIVDLDVFSAKVSERSPGTGTYGSDQDFYGVYARMGFGDNFKEVDVYYLINDDVENKSKVSAAGARAKSKIGEALDYRVEYVAETVDTATSESESLADLEVGYVVMPSQNFRVSLEYAMASKGFNQLYPTGHKWLGFADRFSRQNLTSVKLGLGADIVEGVRGYLMYHQFTRTDNKVAVSSFDGTAYAGSGDSKDVGSEIDIVVGMKLSEAVKLSAGVSQFTPGTYLKDGNLDESGTFGFVQLAASY